MIDTNELDMLRDSAAAFAAKEKDFTKYRAQQNVLPGIDESRFRKIADLGWLGILIPEEYDGLGLGLGEMATVLRELGPCLLAEPIVATAVLGCEVIMRGSNEALKREVLPKMVEGTYRTCLAFQNVQGGISLDDVGVICTGGVLTGKCRFVAGASIGNSFLVAAQCKEGLSVFLVNKTEPGLTIDLEWRADGTCAGLLDLEGVSAGEVVCDVRTARDALNKAFDMAIIAASAEMLGIMEAVLEMTLEYMRTRVQFDKPIGSFQALQHKVVDLYILKEISSGVLQEALTSLPSDSHARGILASRVKSRCSDAILRITRECIQLHGAIGFTYEYDLVLYVHRAMTLAAWLGNGSAQRRRIQQLTTEFNA